MKKLVDKSEAIKIVKNIMYNIDTPSDDYALYECFYASLFFVIKNRYNPHIRYYCYYDICENYTEEDNFLKKIFNNLKENDFAFIGIYDANYVKETTIYFTDKEFLELCKVDSYNRVDEFEIGDLIEDYYTSHNIELLYRSDSDIYDYIDSIDEHKVICNNYGVPKLININDEMISCLTHFTDNERCLRFTDFEYMFVSRDTETNDIYYYINSTYNILEIKSYKHLNDCEIIFVYAYDLMDNSTSYCTDPKFIEYCNVKDNKYMQTHYNIDIVKDYFKEIKNVIL